MKQACTMVQEWWVTPRNRRAIPGGTQARNSGLQSLSSPPLSFHSASFLLPHVSVGGCQGETVGRDVLPGALC